MNTIKWRTEFTVIIVIGIGILGWFILSDIVYKKRVYGIKNLAEDKRAGAIGHACEVGIFGKYIRKGMSKEDVEKIIGAPHNKDNEIVWMWISNYDQYVASGKPLKWTEMYGNDHAVVFILFVNDSLCLMPYSSVQTDPLTALTHIVKVGDESKVMKMLHLNEELAKKLFKYTRGE